LTMPSSSSSSFTGGASSNMYALRESVSGRTDIDILPPGEFGEFGNANPATDLEFAPSAEDWLKRAICRFDLTFGRTTNSVTLFFFSDADALSYRLRLDDLYANIVGPLSRDYVPKTSADALNPADLSRQLCDWLGITYDQLATMTGVSRASFFNWRRPGSNPSPNSVQQVQRLHALVSLLVKRFGVRGARAWLRSGEQPVWDRLTAGDLDSAEDNARQHLFRQEVSSARYNELPLDEEKLDVPAVATGSSRAPRRAARRPTKRRIGPSD